MEGIIKFLDNLVTIGGVSGTLLATCLCIAGLGVMFFYISKSITAITPFLKSNASSITKEELVLVKSSLQEDNKYILQILSEVDNRLKSIEHGNVQVLEINRQLEVELDKVSKLSDDIHEAQDDEARIAISYQKDLSMLVSDSKAQYSELTRQVQCLQKDLASLHGTIIGLNTQRSRLK